MTTSEILENYNKKLEQEDICPKINGEHGFELEDFQWLSNTVCEIKYVCLECNCVRYMYHYLQGSDFIGL